MSFFKWVLVLIGLMALGYNLWSVSGRNYGNYKYAPYPIDEIISEGNNAGKGNIIGFQPYFTAWDYCDQQHFHNALEPYFKKASDAGFFKANTIVVLPEYTGSWLVASNEKASVYQADSMRQAMSIIVNSRIFSFILKLISAKPEDKIQYALFSLKARSMAKIYSSVFSSLAKKYKVTIVAGSIILPGPSVNSKGKLIIKGGRLYVASFVFGPDGNIIAQPVRKMALSSTEKKFLTPAGIDEHRIIQTQSGSLAVLLSADSRKAEVYTQIKGKTNMIAVPFMSGLEPMLTSLVTSPENASDSGISNTENPEAWPAAGLGKIAVNAGIHQGIHVFFSGKLWERQPKGGMFTLQKDSLRVHQLTAGKGRIINVWFN